jgi:hypothetical protein
MRLTFSHKDPLRLFSEAVKRGETILGTNLRESARTGSAERRGLFLETVATRFAKQTKELVNF